MIDLRAESGNAFRKPPACFLAGLVDGRGIIERFDRLESTGFNGNPGSLILDLSRTERKIQIFSFIRARDLDGLAFCAVGFVPGLYRIFSRRKSRDFKSA